MNLNYTVEELNKMTDAEFIRACWGEAGSKVLEEISKVTPFNDNFDNFLTNCYLCGGDWGGMILTGIEKVYPTVYEAIPNSMGPLAFQCIIRVLVLCGVTFPEN